MTQTNKASSNADAGNLNATEQTATQTQTGDSCKCKSGGEQLIGQKADSEQGRCGSRRDVSGEAVQREPLGSGSSKGDDGSVEQTNKATSDASAGNLNVTKQSA